jgi:predicted nucleotidyltransferase
MDMSNQTAREGDFIETLEGLIFDVKGVVHPPNRVVSFLRYYPLEVGSRQRAGINYGKVYNLDERFDILGKDYPHYLYEDAVFGLTLQGVPLSSIRQVYRPVEVLEQLRTRQKRDALQDAAVQLAEVIQEASNIEPSMLGISGSILVNLHEPTSDLDLIVYGRHASRAVQEALHKIHKTQKEGIAGYTQETYQPIFDLRWKRSGLSFEDALEIDSGKAMHRTFQGRDYFIRAILDWDEVEEAYGDHRYRKIGYAKAQVAITDHSEGLFTPCRYKIKEVNISAAKKIREIVSFRGRFSEQARRGETVIVQGTLEEVVTKTDRWARFVLGSNPRDLLIPERLA